MRLWRLTAVAALAWPGSPVTAAEPSPQEPAAKTDVDGDPLPEGAVLRLGSKRWRIPAEPRRFTFSRDRSVLQIGTNTLSVEQLDVKTGRRLAVLGTPMFLWGLDAHVGMAFSADGRRFATVEQGDSKLCVTIRHAEGKADPVRIPFREIPKHDAPKFFSGSSTTVQLVTALAFSPNGKVLAGADWYRFERDGSVEKEKIHEQAEECVIRLWDTATGKDLAVCTGHDKQVHTLSFSADGKTLTSASEDGTIRFWDTETGRERGKPWQARLPIHATAFSPDGKQIAAGTAKGLEIWDVATATVSRRLETPGAARAVAYTPDGKTLAGGGEVIRFWAVDTGRPAGELPTSQPVRALAFSADGLTLFSGHEREHKIRRWDAAARRPVAEPEGLNGVPRLLAFSRDGKQLITFGPSDGFRAWGLADGKPAPAVKEDDPELFLGLTASTGRSAPLLGADSFAATISLMLGEVYRLDQIPDMDGASTDGRRVLTASDKDEKSVFKVRDLVADRVLREIPGEGKNEFRAALAPDGNTVAVAGKEGISFVDVDTGRQRRYPFDATKRETFFSGGGLKFTPDGSRLALVGGGGTVNILAVADGRLRQEIKTGERNVSGLAFSPDGQTLLTIATFGSVSLWEVATGQLIRREAPGVYQFSPNNRLLLSSNGADNIVLIDLYTGNAVREYKAGAAAINFTLAPDGRHLAVAYDDCTVVIWDTAIPPAEVASKAERLAEFWADLEAGPAQPAYAAIGALAADPKRALPLLGERLKAAERPDQKTIARRIADLGHDQFAKRQQAERELYLVGTAAQEALAAAREKTPDPEAKVRIERLLKRIDQDRGLPAPAERAHLRAVQVLERIGTAEARALLRRLSEGDAAALRTAAARAALRRWGR